MLDPHAALKTLEDAADLLTSLNHIAQQGSRLQRQTESVREEVRHMRDELYGMLVLHDPVLNAALWAWLEITAAENMKPMAHDYSKGTDGVMLCDCGHRWVRTRQQRRCPKCHPAK